jgi:hypothetical protein
MASLFREFVLANFDRVECSQCCRKYFPPTTEDLARDENA